MNRVAQSLTLIVCLTSCAYIQNDSKPSSSENYEATIVGTNADTVTDEYTNTDVNSNSNTSIPVLEIESRILGEARSPKFVAASITPIQAIYEQCGIDVQFTVKNLPIQKTADLTEDDLLRLSINNSDQPVVNVIQSTDRGDVAFSYLPSLQSAASSTAWITNRVSDDCFSWIVAHEIAHIVFNHPNHVFQRNNVMNPQCSAGSNYNRTNSAPRFTALQCRELRDNITTREPAQ